MVVANYVNINVSGKRSMTVPNYANVSQYINLGLLAMEVEYPQTQVSRTEECCAGADTEECCGDGSEAKGCE
jgi:hypothetical protein